MLDRDREKLNELKQIAHNLSNDNADIVLAALIQAKALDTLTLELRSLKERFTPLTSDMGNMVDLTKRMVECAESGFQF